MQSARSLLIIVFLLASVVPAVAKDAWHANRTLLAATSPFKEMVDFALAQNDPGIAKALAVADRQAAAVKAVLPAPDAGSFDELLQTIHTAASGDEYQDLAVTAMEVIRFLLDGLQPGALRVPKEVRLLDYAGFKLRVLATFNEPDWGEMSKTAENASVWWKAIESRVSNKALRNACSTTVAALQEATQNEDLPMLHMAAQIDLDLVNLLERRFRSR